MLLFEWDEGKDRQNIRKHGISFEEAKSVFADSHARLIADPEHSVDEDRFVLLGMSWKLKILIVCHCYRKNDQVIRIISARRADKKEQKTYMEGTR